MMSSIECNNTKCYWNKTVQGEYYPRYYCVKPHGIGLDDEGRCYSRRETGEENGRRIEEGWDK